MGNKRIAVVGAGLSGLAAALRLGEAGFAVEVFEKSRGVSGRAASRTHEGCRYDIGANYFKVESNEVARLVFQRLPTEGLCRIVGDVLAFDGAGDILPRETSRGNASRWTYREGISSLGKRIAAAGSFAVKPRALATRLGRTGETWRIETDDGGEGAGFAAVLLTPPAPQTAALLQGSDLPEPQRADLVSELERATYISQFSVALNYPGEHSLPGQAYALINADRRHDLAWVGHENRKPGRVPPGESLFVVQLSPEWTRRNYEMAPEAVAARASDALRRLAVPSLPEPRWSDVQRWRYALPDGAAETTAMAAAAASGLFFAGDCLVGRGRVGGAIETGLAAAEAIRSRLV